MRARPGNFAERKQGVALIIVLGLLAVLTLLSVAFAIAMRIERLAARNYANEVRAKHLVRAALVRAMEDIDKDMKFRCYPGWDARHSKAFLAPPVDPDMMTGEASNAIPSALWSAANVAKAPGTPPLTSGWISQGITNGRLAYLAVNTAGLIDANRASGTEREWSTNLFEISPGNILYSGDVNGFVASRQDHRHYEAIQELGAINPSVREPVSDFFVYSYDVDRDEFFRDPANPPTYMDTRLDPAELEFGLRTTALMLTNKFCLNDITNYAGYYRKWDLGGYRNDLKFMSNYYHVLYQILQECGFGPPLRPHDRPADVCWNIINYLDPDRIPQSGYDDPDTELFPIMFPWAHTEGGEPLPLINEIVFDRVPAKTNWYKFMTELWYPFAPKDIQPTDGFYLKVALFTKKQWNEMDAGARPDPWLLMEPQYCYTSWMENLPVMQYSTDNEFKVVTNEFQLVIDGTTMVIGVDQPIFYNARVYKREYNTDSTKWEHVPVDEAPGYRPDDGNWSGGSYGKRCMLPFTEPRGFSVWDPRSNGQIKYWVPGGYVHPAIVGAAIGGRIPQTTTTGIMYTPGSLQETLGRINKNCGAAYEPSNQRTPIWAKHDGPMRNIGELGHIFRSNLDDEYAGPKTIWWWRTINLMHRDEGASLLDLLTVRPKDQQGPIEGVFAINSRQKEAIKAMFWNLEIGPTNVPGVPMFKIPNERIDALAEEIIATHALRESQGLGGFINFRSIFDSTDGANSTVEGGGTLAKKFRECAKDGELDMDIMREDTFRSICELITFRQNIFTIVLAGQAMSPDPDGSGSEQAVPVAEKRAVATVYRDSYTGRYFVRSFKWLAD